MNETIRKEIHDFFRWGLPRTRKSEILKSNNWFQVSAPDFRTPSFNEVLFSDVSSDLFEQKVTETITHYKKLGTGFKWCISPYSSPQNSKEILLENNFKHWTSMMMCQNLDQHRFFEPPSGIKVEEANSDDVDTFVDLFMKCWDLPAEDRERYLDEIQFNNERQDCKFTRFTVSVEDTPVGVASMVQNQKYGYLHATSVIPEFRGRGAYKALVMKRLDKLKEKGCSYAISGARAKTSGPILKHFGFEKLWDIDMFLKEPGLDNALGVV